MVGISEGRGLQTTAVPSRRSRVLCFGPFRLETSNELLIFNDRPIKIPPRAFAVLRLLAENSGALVTKEDLIEKVWGGAFIEESNITKSVAEIRRILRPGFKEIDPITTVWKQGYRFAIPVTVSIADTTLEEPEQAAASLAPVEASVEPNQLRAMAEVPPLSSGPFSSRRALWGLAGALAAFAVLVYLVVQVRPSAASSSRQKVAVLSIRNLSNDPSADWLGAALTETLTSELQTGASLRAVSAERVANMRTDLGLAPGAAYDSATLQKVQANLGCQLAVTGTYLSTGHELRLDLHVHETSSGETRGTLSETGSTENLLEFVARAGGDLRRLLGEQKAAPSPQAQAAVSSEALGLYAQGMERLRAWDARGAGEFFTKALAAGGDSYAPVHAGLSLNWSLLGFDQRARDEARKALDAANGLPREQQLQIEALYAEAGADWPKAIETWRALLRFYPDQPDYAERLAGALTRGGKAAEALNLLRTLPSSDPRLLLASARASFALSDYNAALRQAGVALEQARKRSSRLMESRALSVRAGALDFLSEFEKARADIQEAGRISASLGDRSGYAEALYHDAAIARIHGDGKDLDQKLKQALSIASEIGNRHLSREILNELTNLHRNQADMAGALEFADQALAIARETADASGEAASLNDAGNLLNNTGHPDQARERYAESLQRGTEAGDRRRMAIELGNLGILDYTEGDLPEAVSRMQKALELKRAVGDRESIAYTLNYLGRVLILAGRLGEARKYLDEADALLKSIGQKSIAPAILSARLDIIEGHPEKAEGPLTAMAAKFELPSPKCEILYVLAESWLARGNLEKARAVTAEAVALAAKTPNRADFGIPANLMAARVEMALGHFDRANQQLNSLLAESRTLKNVPNELNVRYAMECLEKNRGNLRAASETGRSLQRDAERMGFGLIASATQRVDTLAVLRLKEF